MQKKESKKNGFTALEMIMVIAVIVLLIGATLVIINPIKRIQQSQDVQRGQDIKEIMSKVANYAMDNTGGMVQCANLGTTVPTDGIYRCIGTGSRPSNACIVKETCQSVDGCCYTSLSEWFADYGGLPDGDLVSQEKIAVVKITGPWSNPDTQPFVISGNDWKTNSEYYIKIYTDDTARHSGVWDNTKYRLSLNYNGALINNTAKYLKIEGLQIYNPSTGSSAGGIYHQTSGVIEISHNIIRGNLSNANSKGMGLNSSGILKIRNNIFYDWGSGIKHITSQHDPTLVVYNNTFFNCTYGIYLMAMIPMYPGLGNVYVKNNLFQGVQTGGPIALLIGGAKIGYNNICETVACYGSFGPQNTATFLSRGSPPDLHLDPADGVAIDAGFNLSADPHGFLSFTDDFDVESRPAGAGWDVGADEVGGTSIITADSDQCCNLEPSLIPGYVKEIPEDPTGAQIGYTGYEIMRDSNGVIYIRAPYKSKYILEDLIIDSR